MVDQPETTGLVATFDREEDLLEAVQRLRQAGQTIREVFSPYPIHVLDGLLGRKRSRLPWVSLAAGAFGAVSALGFQFYAAVIDWPVNVGGKPANSTLAFIPITFEATVLAAGVLTAVAFLAVSRLYPGASPRLPAPGVTDDRFALLLDESDGELDPQEVVRLLEECDVENICEAGDKEDAP